MSEDIKLLNEKRIDFFIMDNNIFDYELDGNSFMVYSLMQKMSRDYSCFPSINYICDKLKLSNKTVIKCIGILEEKLLITVTRHEKEKEYDENGQIVYKQKNNIYTLKDISERKSFPNDSVNFSKDQCNFFQEPVEILHTNKTTLNKTIKQDNIYGDKPQTQKRKSFIAPTLEQVQEYCKERNNNVNAEKFIDFYTSKGWCVGKNKMKDWKASVRTWEQNAKEKSTSSPKQNNWLEKERAANDSGVW